MSISERIEIVASSFWAWLGATAGVGVIWLVRQVLTNQKRIALLEMEIAHRDHLRSEDREAMKEVRESVKRIEDVVLHENRR